MSYERNQVPQWRPGYRFQFEPAQQGYVLLYPEGMIKLNDSAAEIGQCIDGKSSVSNIIATLNDKFPGVDELANDVDEFMQVAHEQHWISLT